MCVLEYVKGESHLAGFGGIFACASLEGSLRTAQHSPNAKNQTQHKTSSRGIFKVWFDMQCHFFVKDKDTACMRGEIKNSMYGLCTCSCNVFAVFGLFLLVEPEALIKDSVRAVIFVESIDRSNLCTLGDVLQREQVQRGCASDSIPCTIPRCFCDVCLPFANVFVLNFYHVDGNL